MPDDNIIPVDTKASDEALEAAYRERLARYEAAKADALEGAEAALRQLIDTAQGDTGQSRICRRFLLGLYNGAAWPFVLTELRGLDLELADAALTVLRADALQAWGVEVHQVLGADTLFRQWWEEEQED